MHDILRVQHLHAGNQLVRQHERRLEREAVAAAAEQAPQRSAEEVADHELDAVEVVCADVVEGGDAGLLAEVFVKGGFVLQAAFGAGAAGGVEFQGGGFDGDDFVCLEVGGWMMIEGVNNCPGGNDGFT
jgi:predicted phage tail protein